MTILKAILRYCGVNIIRSDFINYDASKFKAEVKLFKSFHNESSYRKMPYTQYYISFTNINLIKEWKYSVFIKAIIIFVKFDFFKYFQYAFYKWSHLFYKYNFLSCGLIITQFESGKKKNQFPRKANFVEITFLKIFTNYDERLIKLSSSTVSIFLLTLFLNLSLLV